jgi:hypothetical protein
MEALGVGTTVPGVQELTLVCECGVLMSAEALLSLGEGDGAGGPNRLLCNSKGEQRIHTLQKAEQLTNS